MGADFHQKLRDAFLKIAGDNPDRCVIVDASGSIPEVSNAVWKIMEQKLDLT